MYESKAKFYSEHRRLWIVATLMSYLQVVGFVSVYFMLEGVTLQWSLMYLETVEHVHVRNGQCACSMGHLDTWLLYCRQI